jgi:hypothetical protein
MGWMSRPRHPNKHIDRAIQYAEQLGWRVELSNGHPWGKILCPHAARDGCTVIINSTPKNPENHARHVQRDIDLCPHYEKPSDGNEEESGENL